jgi:glucan phosphoethanolaminetransferase (alkaline phosphatase superfamily)
MLKLQNYYRISLLIIGFLLTTCSMVEAAQHSNVKPIKVENYQPLKRKKSSAKQFVKSLFPKKNKLSNDGNRIRNSGMIAFAIGLFSFLLLIFGIALLFASGGGIVLLLAALAAIVGDIFSIRTLVKIRNSENPEDYQGSKILSIFGLVFSLLTGLIPLALLILALLTI